MMQCTENAVVEKCKVLRAEGEVSKALNELAKTMYTCGYDEKDYMDALDSLAKYAWTWCNNSSEVMNDDY